MSRGLYQLSYWPDPSEQSHIAGVVSSVKAQCPGPVDADLRHVLARPP